MNESTTSTPSTPSTPTKTPSTPTRTARTLAIRTHRQKLRSNHRSRSRSRSHSLSNRQRSNSDHSEGRQCQYKEEEEQQQQQTSTNKTSEQALVVANNDCSNETREQVSSSSTSRSMSEDSIAMMEARRNQNSNYIMSMEHTHSAAEDVDVQVPVPVVRDTDDDRAVNNNNDNGCTNDGDDFHTSSNSNNPSLLFEESGLWPASITPLPLQQHHQPDINNIHEEENDDDEKQFHDSSITNTSIYSYRTATQSMSSSIGPGPGLASYNNNNCNKIENGLSFDTRNTNTDLSYDTRNIVHDPTFLLQSSSKVKELEGDDHDDHHEDDYENHDGDDHEKNELNNSSNNDDDDHEKQKDSYCEYDKMCEESLLDQSQDRLEGYNNNDMNDDGHDDDHDDDDEELKVLRRVDALSQQERIDSYNTYIEDSESENDDDDHFDDDTGYNEDNHDDDDDNKYDEMNDDEEEDVSYFQSYACLEDNGDDHDHAFPTNGFHNDCQELCLADRCSSSSRRSHDREEGLTSTETNTTFDNDNDIINNNNIDDDDDDNNKMNHIIDNDDQKNTSNHGLDTSGMTNETDSSAGADYYFSVPAVAAGDHFDQMTTPNLDFFDAPPPPPPPYPPASSSSLSSPSSKQKKNSKGSDASSSSYDESNNDYVKSPLKTLSSPSRAGVRNHPPLPPSMKKSPKRMTTPTRNVKIQSDDGSSTFNSIKVEESKLETISNSIIQTLPDNEDNDTYENEPRDEFKTYDELPPQVELDDRGESTHSITNFEPQVSHQFDGDYFDDDNEEDVLLNDSHPTDFVTKPEINEYPVENVQESQTEVIDDHLMDEKEVKQEKLDEEPADVSPLMDQVMDARDTIVSKDLNNYSEMGREFTSPTTKEQEKEADLLLQWIKLEILERSSCEEVIREYPTNQKDSVENLRNLLRLDNVLNTICKRAADSIESLNTVENEDALNVTSDSSFLNESLTTNVSTDIVKGLKMEKAAIALLKNNQRVNPFTFNSDENCANTTAANFVSFLQKLSYVSGIASPIQGNPFLDNMISSSLQNNGFDAKNHSDFWELGFGDNQMMLDQIKFLQQVCTTSSTENTLVEIEKDQSTFICDVENLKQQTDYDTHDEGCVTPSITSIERKEICPTTKRNNKTKQSKSKSLEVLKDFSASLSSIYLIPPEESPSPFEITIWKAPSILMLILSCLGDPCVVCRMKGVNRFCRRIIMENEYTIMKDSVRIGGIDNRMRPSFWLWITLEKCKKFADKSNQGLSSLTEEEEETDESQPLHDFNELERKGRESKWHHVIERDVPRAFGNMPPHKAKTNKRSSSIVRALVSWGSSQFLMKRQTNGVSKIATSPSHTESEKGKPIRRLSIATPKPHFPDDSTVSDVELERTDTVSDWSGISPVGSTVSSNTQHGPGSGGGGNISHDLVLSSRGLSAELKVDLQKKLETILDAIAGAHEGVGYCQGMDYVVCHLLRNLQSTLEYNAMRGTLPKMIRSSSLTPNTYEDEPGVVEEAVFRVMHTFLTTYGIEHMYFPELRCLKTCCRIFERIIEKKLPVLADHFDYHDLQIGMFALGWFQTLFLYIPSMPAPTINHIWDIWLVERSMKIFFRIATAILFLSQPILLNHDLEGMMLYLNTFPDATIFNPHILINCGLQIKITNQMLEDIEIAVSRANDMAHGMI